ncbi:HPP family protein [Pseudomonas nitroreducens]|uniref:HPP family protein n=1 Tax=Pseudomonas nitroreducens TaxID=46680 RepID=UPI0020A1139E|nr:CBS domain-containing protein [Pseudomonas nitroreducens]MCP1626216.1 CBS domain-containing membrane protein [Pseudomonas nitroreducens]
MPALTGWRHRAAAYLPDIPHTRPREWLRASLGASLGFLLSAATCGLLFGSSVALHFAGPWAASAVLLFAVSSGALAQPWSVIGSYLCASLVALLIGLWLPAGIASAALALGLSLLLMYPLRCLHPPGGALAFCMVFASPTPGEPVWLASLSAISGGLGLVLLALLFNNLTRMPYPRRRSLAADNHQTRDPAPGARLGIQAADLDQALDELEGFVDITRDDLERLVRSTERHALRRSMGDTRAREVMSRDLICASPETPLSHALRLLVKHHLKALPILDEERRLVGIVSLIDLLVPRGTWWKRLLGSIGLHRDRLLGEVMTRPVLHVDAGTHVVELIPLLSDQGLHCLPVLERGELVGVITQTDLIAALQRDLLSHLG